MRAHNNQMGLKKILSCPCSGCSQSHRFREFSGWNMLIWFFPLFAFGSRAGENFLVSKLQRSSWRLSWKRGHIFPLKSFPFRQPEAKTQMRQDQSRGYLCQKRPRIRPWENSDFVKWLSFQDSLEETRLVSENHSGEAWTGNLLIALQILFITLSKRDSVIITGTLWKWSWGDVTIATFATFCIYHYRHFCLVCEVCHFCQVQLKMKVATHVSSKYHLFSISSHRTNEIAVCNDPMMKWRKSLAPLPLRVLVITLVALVSLFSTVYNDWVTNWSYTLPMTKARSGWWWWWILWW